MASESDMIKVVKSAKAILDEVKHHLIYSPDIRLAIDYYEGDTATTALGREMDACDTAMDTLEGLKYTKL